MSAPVSNTSSSPTPTRTQNRTSAPTRTSQTSNKATTTRPSSPPPTRDSVQLSTAAQDQLKTSNPAPARTTVAAGGNAPAAKGGGGQAVEGKWDDPKWQEGYTQRMEQMLADNKAGKLSDAELSDGISRMYGESMNKFSAFKAERAAEEQRKAKEKVAAENQAYEGDMGPRRAANAKGQQEINGIVNIKDDKVRNLNITQKYSELSKDMKDMMGPDSGANWSTWATWASKQAGSTIRQEDVGGWGKTGSKMADGLMDGLAPGVGIARKLFGQDKGPMEQTYDGVSKSIANGNRKVFEEIAPHFDRFINTFKGDTAPNDRKWAEFSQGFGKDQQGLRDAFRNYYDARNTDTSTEAGKKAKAELMLMGNNRIGLHEQRRLQPEIEQGMPAGARTVITNTMMGLKLPNETVDLGGDLGPRWDGKQFPDRLQNIQNPDLNNLLRGVDRTPNSLQGTGASDWTNIDDRMNFIVDLFRSRHENPSLYSPPFNPGQVQQMKAGRLPGGPL